MQMTRLFLSSACECVYVLDGGGGGSSVYLSIQNTFPPSTSDTPTPPFVPFGDSWRWQAARILLRSDSMVPGRRVEGGGARGCLVKT